MRLTIHCALAFAAALVAAPSGAATTYGGLTVGNAALDETGQYGYQGLGFGAPTLDHDICGDAATISIGAEPTVLRMDGSANTYRYFLGWRWDQVALEVGRYNVARIESSAVVPGYSVTQPTCTSGSFTVSADGVKLETLEFRGWMLTPVFIHPLSAGWDLEVRATVASWTRDARSEWQVVVTEYDTGVAYASGPIAAEYARIDTEGFDVGFGVGVAWRATDTVRVRALVEDQVFGPNRVRATEVGLVIDF